MLFMSCGCYAFASLIAALWSSARKWLTSWLSFVMFNCDFVTFPCGIRSQVWYLIVLIPDLCPLSYFENVYQRIILAKWRFEKQFYPANCLK